MNRTAASWLASLTFALAACGGSDGTPQQSTSTPEQAPAGTPAPAAGPANPSTSAAATLPPEKTCELANFQQEILTRINQARATARNCGGTAYPAAAALTWNSRLFDAAAAHALDMAMNDYFSHDSRDGRSFSDRISAAGYAWSAAGENIAAGFGSVDGAMAGWLESPGHCANIMGDSFTEVAVSCVRNDAAAYRFYWVMELARPS